ncbi:MAG: hypothetical protein J6S75_10080, partial [Thermoguttaceae bacterium]|nr:hypothetical protein [Thermoguttaceae bacterium]
GMPSHWGGDRNFFSADKGAGRNGTVALRQNADGEHYRLCSQKLDVTPGTRLEFSAYVRTDDPDICRPMIAVEWTAGGKWLGGSYSQKCVEEEGAESDGWTKVGNVVTVPAEADHVTLLCYVFKGGKGTAWFDDCLVKEVITSPYSAITSDHYRHVADGKDRGGELTIRVGVARSSAVASPRDVAAPLVITNQDGAEVMKLDPAAFGDDYIDYIVPAGELTPGKYTAKLTMPGAEDDQRQSISLAFTRVEEYPERYAYIDQYRRLIVDVEPFFPLGCYFGGVSEKDLAIYADSAFNCLMPYASISREDLDRCQASNIKVIYSVKDNFRTLAVNSEQEGIDRTRQTVEKLKDHPAIIAWYINDELPLTMLRELTDRRDLLEELDPTRPAWVVLYQVNDVRSYIPTFDVIGTDPYPIPDNPASYAGSRAVTTNRAVFGLHALWQVPQIFDWASYKKTDEEKKALRPPTLEEMRGMFWMHIAGGANGLVAYSWSDLWRMDKTVAEGGRAYIREPFEQRWAEVKTVAAEVAEFFPVLLSIDPAMDARVSDEQSAKDTLVRLYGHEGKTWMLIVNMLDKNQTVPFEAGEAAGAEVQLGGKLVSFGDGKGTVELEAYQPCFVVLTPKK